MGELREWLPIDTAPKDGTVIIISESASWPAAAKWLVINGDDFFWEGWAYCDDLLMDYAPSPEFWIPMPVNTR